jgi:hypothetical protein
VPFPDGVDDHVGTAFAKLVDGPGARDGMLQLGQSCAPPSAGSVMDQMLAVRLHV